MSRPQDSHDPHDPDGPGGADGDLWPWGRTDAEREDPGTAEDPAGPGEHGSGHGEGDGDDDWDEDDWEDLPTRTPAVVALVLAFLAPTVVAAVVSVLLAVRVLRREPDGREHGRRLAVAALVVDGVLLALSAALVVYVVVVGGRVRTVEDLRTGDCIDVAGLRAGATSAAITARDCDEEHDAQVLAAVTLSAETAERYAAEGPGVLCDDAVAGDEARARALARDDLEALHLTESAEPEAGDVLACLVRKADGSKLTLDVT